MAWWKVRQNELRRRRMEAVKDFNPLGMDTPLEDLKALQCLAKQASQFGFVSVVEVGSWVGRTAKAIRDVEGVYARVFCVDTFRGSPSDVTGLLREEVGDNEVLATFCRNVGADLLTNITPCVGESLAWASVWPFPVDMVFIDADHQYGSVKADINAWKRHVRRGGILCGHDYGDPAFPGVTQAVDELGKDGVAGRCVWWKRL
jgi:SAM-dependent methyltransferase